METPLDNIKPTHYLFFFYMSPPTTAKFPTLGDLRNWTPQLQGERDYRLNQVVSMILSTQAHIYNIGLHIVLAYLLLAGFL